MSPTPWPVKWRIVKFGVPKSGSYTEIAEFVKANGVEAAKKQYADVLLTPVEFGPNGLTNIGIGILWNLAIGNGAYTNWVFNISNARLGVSDDVTAFDASQTNLTPLGGTNVFYQQLDATFPQVSIPQVAFEATFDGSTANYEWVSFGVDNDLANDGTGISTASYTGTTIGLLNRYVSDQGLKPGGQTWVLTLLIGLI
jgi:hypothetical protein